MTKALAIIGAILLALNAGIGIGDETEPNRSSRLIGATVLLFLSMLCGWCAWQL